MFEFAVIVAVIIGVGEAVKPFVPKKYMPVVSMALGLAAGLGFLDTSIQEQVFYGLGMGLAASGLFDVAKLPKKVSK